MAELVPSCSEAGYPDLFNNMKGVLTEKFIALNAYINDLDFVNLDILSLPFG